MKCSDNLTLDDSTLPRFEVQLRVKRAFLMTCPMEASSYGAALNALNVLVLDRLTLAGPTRVGRLQLAGLEALPALVLKGAELEPDAFDAVPDLQRLHMDGVHVPPAALDALPPALQVLELVRTGVSPSAAQLARLPRLRELMLRDAERAVFHPAGRIHKVALESPATHVPRRLLPSLENLVLKYWDERAPGPWQDCDSLRDLVTVGAAAEALPEDWLQACPSLLLLEIKEARALGSLHARALRGATRLRELRVTGSRLRALPAGLLDDARDLTTLDLSRNQLHALPRSVTPLAALRLMAGALCRLLAK